MKPLSIILFLAWPALAWSGMEAIRVAPDGTGFVTATTQKKFLAWGFNYTTGAKHRLIEEFWYEEWPTLVEDFKEMRQLGANTVRIHLQTRRFMKSAAEPNEANLQQLKRLVELAEELHLYLDITGLACYRKKDVPAWYDALSEPERWAVQARFWEAVARTCADSPAVFCYNLMNEPILPGKDKPEADWLAGEFGGMHFVQRIALDLAGRPRAEVAKAWIEQLVEAIRKHDPQHLITLGVIPWAHTWPKAKPIFYADGVGNKLDFVSVHFYPRKGEVDQAIDALKVYELGKPLVIEEIFLLKCGEDDLNAFIDRSQPIADGWLGHYFGKTIEDYNREELDLTGAIHRLFMQYFKTKTPDILK